MKLPHVKIFLKSQSLRVWIWIFAIWAVLEAFCVWLRIGLSLDDVPLKFPMSVSIIEPHLKYWPMLLTFCITAWLAIKLIRKIKPQELFIISLLLICSANLMQGVDGAFIKPLGLNTKWNADYYNEAITIKGPSSKWLAEFNENQPGLMVHTRTHPPFAVLLFRELAGGNGYSGKCSPWPVVAIWIFTASLCAPFLFRILIWLGIGENHAKYIALILTVMPAFNIYSILCLDSMVFFLSLFFLSAVADINARGVNGANISIIACSTAAINLLTFGGVFFFALLLVLAIIWLAKYASRGYLAALLVTAAVFGVTAIGLNFFCGYDHAKAFFTACRLESPLGETLMQHLWLYAESRLEDVCEILLCMGLVPLVMLLSAGRRRLAISDFSDRRTVIALAGIGVLLAIFLGGAYRTGETARACLFIYPYIFLLMRGMSIRTLREIFACCAIQSAAMQFLGTYDW